MVVYNMTNITAANDMFNIVKSTNDLSGGVFLAVFMLVIFLGYIMIFYRQNMKVTIMGGSFFCMVIGTIAFTANWVGSQFVLFPFIVFISSLIAYYFVD